MTERIRKLNDHLRDEAGKALQAELRGREEALVTVTRAEVSPTLEHATIFISILPKEKARVVFGKIKHQIFFLQQALNKRLVMRPVPKVRFEIDTSGERAARIDQLLQKSHK